jgi:hypothetical protein
MGLRWQDGLCRKDRIDPNLDMKRWLHPPFFVRAKRLDSKSECLIAKV